MAPGPLAAARRRRLAARTLATLVAAVAATALAGCGGGDEIPPALSKGAIDAALATTPPAVGPAERRLERAANTLLPGDGDDALAQLDRELEALKGTPVVVNLWGEWCDPCTKEIPVFQRAALELRGEVAFLGVATRTNRAKTEGFLRDELALPYPSILDPDEQVNKSVTGVENIPKTYFYGPAGGKPFVHLGAYTSVEKLKTDIARYGS